MHRLDAAMCSVALPPGEMVAEAMKVIGHVCLGVQQAMRGVFEFVQGALLW